MTSQAPVNVVNVPAGRVPSAAVAIWSYVEDLYPDSFTNHLIHTYGAGRIQRSPYMTQARDDALSERTRPPEASSRTAGTGTMVR